MGRYFQPLRRKMGVVMLVMAGAFMAAWVRSVVDCDVYTSGDWTLISGDGEFSLEKKEAFSHVYNVSNPVRHWGPIPYWSIILPLTTLSAWPLLSKPRTRQPKPELER